VSQSPHDVFGILSRARRAPHRRLSATSGSPGLVAHPAVAVERDSRIAVLRGFKQLGLSEYADPALQGHDGRGRYR
jgi:hypothetical protein